MIFKTNLSHNLNHTAGLMPNLKIKTKKPSVFYDMANIDFVAVVTRGNQKSENVSKLCSQGIPAHSV